MGVAARVAAPPGPWPPRARLSDATPGQGYPPRSRAWPFDYDAMPEARRTHRTARVPRVQCQRTYRIGPASGRFRVRGRRSFAILGSLARVGTRLFEDSAMSGSANGWYVQLADGDLHRVTLDQLDEAFQLGHIGVSTMVLAPGGSRWTKLGHLASIDEPSEALSSQRPVSMDLT